MIVRLQVGTPARQWQLRLAARIEAAGHTVVVCQVPNTGRSHGASFILAVERLLYGAASAGFAMVQLAGDPASTAWDVTLALEGKASGAALDVLFDGSGGEQALITALLKGRAPYVCVRRSNDGRELAAGLPAIEDPYVLARALEQLLIRTETIVLQALATFASGAVTGPRPSAPLAGRWRSPLSFMADTLAAKASARYARARSMPRGWRVMYRERGHGVSDPAAFAPVPDDGSRFYADPFPFEWEGQRCLFLEDYAYRTRKGVIACVTIDADGSASVPRTVLDLPVHLSYPFVFADGGVVYMLPEMSGARCVQLYCASRFPDRWVADRVLLADIVANDATLVRHDGLWWLFATVSGDGGSSWDQLCLFHAPALAGPWTAHAGNPVLIDAGAARPGGAMWQEEGVLMRVAQDCRRDYGDALAICRVDRLDQRGFAQTVLERRRAPDGWSATGMHTLNRSATLEVMDLHVARGRERL